MMKVRILLTFIALLALPAMAQPASNSVSAQTTTAHGSVWSIHVVGLKGETLGDLTIEMLDESGVQSCRGGLLKKARLVQSSLPSLAREFEAKGYFPTYWADGERMVFELNYPGMCDSYLYLRGKFTAREGKGDYIKEQRGWSSPLGTFTAKRRR